MDEIAEGRTSKNALDSDGIIRIVCSNEIHTENDIKEDISVINQIAKGRKFPLLIDMTAVKEMSSECRRYYETEEAMKSVSAIAVIFGSTVSKTMADFFISFGKQTGPQKKIFDNKEKANQWLKKFIQYNFDIQKYINKHHIAVLELIENETSQVFLGDDGIIRILYFDEIHTEENAKEITEIVDRIAKNKKYPILMDSIKVKAMTPESKRHYESEEALKSAAAIAILIGSPISKIMADFFFNLTKRPGPPRKVFNDENKATIWLKNYYDSSNTANKNEIENTNVLVYEPVNQLQKPVILALIKNGLKCLCIQDKNDIRNKIKSKKYNIFICSCSPETPDIVEIIKDIKHDSDSGSIKVILWSKPAPKEFFENMIKLGIRGIILKPFVLETFEKNIISLLFRDNYNIDRRQNIRIEPDSSDRVIVAIRTSTTHKTITGKLKSISMNGMVIELTGNITEEDLKENDEILNNNIKITINEDEIETSGIVLTRRLSIVVFKFVEMQEYYQNVLSSYIYKRLNV